MQKWQNKKIIIIILIIILIGIYLLATIVFFVKEKLFPTFFHMPDKPYFIYIPQWIYAIILIISLIRFEKKPNRYWLLLNIASWGLISISILTYFILSSVFYVCIIEYFFFIEIISLFLLIYINRSKEIKTHKIDRTLIKYIKIFLIPLIITIFIYVIYYFYYKYGIRY
jgi:hypothetical protein